MKCTQKLILLGFFYAYLQRLFQERHAITCTHTHMDTKGFRKVYVYIYIYIYIYIHIYSYIVILLLKSQCLQESGRCVSEVHGFFSFSDML